MHARGTPPGYEYTPGVECRYLFDYDAQLVLAAAGNATIHCLGAQIVLRAKTTAIIVAGAEATLAFQDCSMVTAPAFPDVEAAVAATGPTNTFAVSPGVGSTIALRGGDLWTSCEVRSPADLEGTAPQPLAPLHLVPLKL